MSRVVIGSAAYKITADTSGLTDGVKITRREIGQANRILEQTKPAAQKLEESMALLEKAFNAGTISAEKYNQALATLHQQKNMLAANTSQVAQALKKLPLPDVAKQAIDAAANVKQLGEALKTLMASPQVLAMVAAVGALTVAYRFLQAEIEKAKKAQEELLEQRERVAAAAARTATTGTEQELNLIKQINEERRRDQELLLLRDQIQSKINEQAKEALVIQDEIARLEEEILMGGLTWKVNELKEQLRTAQERLATNEQTRDLLRSQTEEIDRLVSEEGKAQQTREDRLRRLNKFYDDRKSLDEELIRLQDIAAGKDAERERMMRGMNDIGQKELQQRFDQIDALNAQIEAQRQAEKEREEAARKQIDDIKDAIREHEKLTEEMQKQAEAIKDAQDPSRALGRRLGDLEQMGLQGMLSPEEVAAAIAEAVGQHLDAMERDKQSVQMIDRNTMAHIQFEQKMQTEAEKREKKSLQIQEKQAEILGNIERTNQATADALAALDLV
jgi:hypothetical protein